MVYSHSDWEVAFEEESTYGTDPNSSREAIGDVQTLSPTTTSNNLKILSIGNGQTYRTIEQQGVEHSGTLDFYIQNGKIFQYVIGASSDSGTGPYTHTMNLDDELKSVSLEAVNTTPDTNWQRIFKGVKFGQLTLSATQGGDVKSKMNWVAQSQTSSDTTGNIISNLGTDPFVFSDGKVEVDNSGSYETVAEMKDFSLKVNRNFENRYYIDDSGIAHERAEPFEKHVDIDLTGTAEVVDHSLYDSVENADDIKTKITLKRGTDDKMVYEMTGGRFNKNPIECKLEGPLTEAWDLSFTDLTLTVTDSTDTY